jgi:hypothetical protein
VFSFAEWFLTEFQEFYSIFVHGMDFRVVFSSAEECGREFQVVFSSSERFGKEFREFVYFCSTARNSELFSLPRKGSERNSESLLFRGTAGIP